jgi:hypothetical protein
VPHYYFHVVLGPVHIHDAYGADLPNEGAARARALEDIKALWNSNSIRQRDPAECAVVVTSMDDTELFRVPFVEAPGVYQTTTCLGDERIEAEKI